MHSQLLKVRLLGFSICSLLLSLSSFSQEQELGAILKTKLDSIQVKKLYDYAHSIRDQHPKESERICKIAIERSSQINYYAGVGNGWLMIGSLYGQTGDFKKSIDYFRLAKDCFTKEKMPKGVAAILINIGSVYTYLGKKDSAVTYFLESIKVLEGTAFHHELATAYNNLAVLIGDTKDYSKKIGYLNKAIAIARAHKDTTVLVKALCDLGNTLADQGQISEAVTNIREGLLLAEQSGNIRFQGQAYTFLSHLYLEQKKADSALQAGKKAIKYTQAAHDFNTYSQAAINLSDILDFFNSQNERLSILKEVVVKNEEAGSLSFMGDLYKKLADASFKLGHYKEAYLYHQKFKLNKDSVLNDKNIKAIAELETQYQTAKKEKALSQKELQLQESRQYVGFSIGAAGIALLTAALVFVNYRNKKKVHKQQLQSLQQEKELQLLQAAIEGEEKERSRIAKDLHDGVAGMLAAAKMHFSSLSIKNEQLLGTKEYGQGIHLLNEAAVQVRKTSHNLMPEVLLKHGLNIAMARYCASISNEQLLVVRYEGWGQIGRYNSNFELSVYRIVQELLNNIIKHSQATQATVQLSAQEERLCIIIEDNGVGLKEGAKPEGMGLHSLEARVKAMHGKFEMETQPNNGVFVYLEFNIGGLRNRNLQDTTTPILTDEILN
jgi:signal transduction histidine kinase